MRRSTAGPMDWQYEHPNGDGPARKRPHYDPTYASEAFLSRPSPAGALFPSQSGPTYGSFSSSSPSGSAFLFQTPDALRPTTQHGSRLPPASAFSFDPGAFNPVTAFGIPEVEMEAGGGGGQPTDGGSTGADDDGNGGGGAAALTASSSTAAQPDEPAPAQKEPRKLAGGAVKRELRKRLGAALGGGGRSRSRRARGAYVEDEDGDGSVEGASASDDDAGHSLSDDDDRQPPSRRSGSSFALARTTSRRSTHRRRNTSSDRQLQRQSGGSTHYNLHMPGSGGGVQGGRVAHGEVPYILLGYLQFFFNLALVLILLYLAVQFILTVRADIQRKVEEASFDIVQEIASCTASYLANHCEPSKRVPAMHQACTTWEYCMNRDPLAVGRAQVGAETFAGVVNGFVDPISWKTMGFTLVTLSFLTVLTNSALSFYRASHRPSSASPPAHHAQQQHQPWLPASQGQYAGLPGTERGGMHGYGGAGWAVGAPGGEPGPGGGGGPAKRAGWLS